MRKLFIFNILISFFLLLSSFGCSSYPTDQYLVENFQNNKADFEKLVSVIQQDSKVISVNKDGEVLDINYQNNKNVISKERLEEYFSLLHKINALNIRVYTGHNKDRTNFSSISISVWDSPSWFYFVGGNHKSYTYTFEKPERIVESLDEIKSKGGDASHYKKISENWYLYLDIW